MPDLDRAFAQLAIRSLQRGLARGRLPEIRPPAPRQRRPSDFAGVDFSQPQPAPPTRLPPGFVPVLVVVAVMLAAMVASMAFRLR